MNTDKVTYHNQSSVCYEEELIFLGGKKTTTEEDLFKKRMYNDKNFVELMEYMLEDTLFNLMEEATFEEFDLTQAPKIYIRKDDPKI